MDETSTTENWVVKFYVTSSDGKCSLFIFTTVTYKRRKSQHKYVHLLRNILTRIYVASQPAQTQTKTAQAEASFPVNSNRLPKHEALCNILFVAVTGVLGLQRRCRIAPCRLSANAYSQLSYTFGTISSNHTIRTRHDVVKTDPLIYLH